MMISEKRPQKRYEVHARLTPPVWMNAGVEVDLGHMLLSPVCKLYRQILKRRVREEGIGKTGEVAQHV